jgi:hypothetical protein
VYLDDQVQATLAKLAQAKDVELSTLINDLLRSGGDRGSSSAAR